MAEITPGSGYEYVTPRTLVEPEYQPPLVKEKPREKPLSKNKAREENTIMDEMGAPLRNEPSRDT